MIDLYQLDDGTDSLLASLDDTIVTRGAHRLDHSQVTRTGASCWRVPGDPKLGDVHAFYPVTHDGNFWRCPCAKSKGRNICSHITAAIMFRHRNPDAPYPEVDPAPRRPAPIPQPAAVPVSDLIPPPTDPMFGRPPLPGKFAAIHPHQWTAAESIIEEFQTKDLVFVDAPTGCLSGDTEIHVNKNDATRKMKLRNLYRRYTGDGDNYRNPWQDDDVVRVRCAVNGSVLLGEVSAVVKSGVKPTFTLTTDTGRTIRATQDHRFFTTAGWKTLADLRLGDFVCVDNRTIKAKPRKARSYYKRVQGLYSHPFAGSRELTNGGGWMVGVHRLVAEARLNGLGYNEFVGRILDGNVAGLEFIDPVAYAVHHVDEDPTNNDPANLAVLTHTQHAMAHAAGGVGLNAAVTTGVEYIVSIVPHGDEMTFDISMRDEPHNFIADGFVVHNSGKTLIAELVRRLALGPMQKTAYICSSIQLQAQFTSDFHYSREIKGRSNYTPLSDQDGVTCADCTATPPDDPDCFWCPEISACPYRVAKSHAAAAPLAVLNTSYFLHAANYAGEFADRDLVIVDECDVLEKELMGFIEVSIGDRMVRDLDLGQPAKVTIPASWQEWLDDRVLPAMADELKKLPRHTDDVAKLRRRRNLEQLIAKLKLVSAGLLDGNWVFDDYQQGRATFRPIRVDGFGKDLLWPHGKKWLLMSATIVSPDTLAESLGWDRDFGVVTVPHTFDPANRQVNVVPVVSMTAKTKDMAYPEMANALCNLAEMYPDKRMLVHTVSYELARYLAESLACRVSTRRIHSYGKASERERALASFKRTPGGILLAPSMDRGVDLPGEDAEVVVVCKIPFPSLGNKQVSARLHTAGGKTWYATETVRSLVQMTGRHIRSADDVGVTFILDGQFTSNIWAKSRHLLPGWFKEALNFHHPKRAITARV